MQWREHSDALDGSVTSMVQFLQNREIGLPKTYTKSLKLFFEIRDDIDFLCDVINEDTEVELLQFEDPVVAEMKHLRREKLLQMKRERRIDFLEERRKRLASHTINTRMW